MKSGYRKLNHWEQLPGRAIEEIRYDKHNATVAIFFEDETWVEFESCNPHIFLYFYAADVNFADPEDLDVSTVVGRKILRITVPFLAPDNLEHGDEFGDAAVRFGLDDGSFILLASEAADTPVQFT